jgi:hypothetical protein
MAMSAIINVRINIRDFINGVIAGGVAMLCTSFFIKSVIFSLIVGSTAGLVLVLVQNLLERKFAKNFNIISTYSFCLFGVQGFIGSIYGTIFRSFYSDDYYIINYTNNPIKMGLKSLGIGLGLGLLVGLFIKLLNYLIGNEL